MKRKPKKKYKKQEQRISKAEWWVLCIITFLIAFWFAPNDWWPWWSMDVGKHEGQRFIVEDIPVDIGTEIVLITREYYEDIKK